VDAAIHYARSGDVHIAYAVFGEGPQDVVVVPGFVSAVDLAMEGPAGPFMRRLAQVARVITLDKRGTGLSDRDVALPGLDERMDDVRAVMDAVGSARAHIAGVSEGGPMSIVFAATFPQRVQSLLLYGSFATFVKTDDNPWMLTADERIEIASRGAELWGTGRSMMSFFPREERSDALQAVLGRIETRAASPGTMLNISKMNLLLDVRAILPTINVPTLVVHASADQVIPIESGRYLAENIPGARLIETSLTNHLSLREDAVDEWIDDYVEQVTGSRATEPLTDRVLATVLFTDIVGSTQAAVDRGDASWRALLDRHDEIVQREVTRFRGTLVKQTGDGALAHFDGPARAVSAGLAVRDALRPLGIDVRAGVHTGEIELRGDDIGGIAVHVAARVMSLAGTGELLATRTVRDLTAGSGLRFEDRGEHSLKGVPEAWQLYAVN
jgi:class 3 adenylate cyclase